MAWAFTSWAIDFLKPMVLALWVRSQIVLAAKGYWGIKSSVGVRALRYTAAFIPELTEFRALHCDYRALLTNLGLANSQ